MKSIQGKILFVVVSTLVVITVLVSTIAVTITHEIMHRDADRILNNVSQKEAAQINEMLNDFEQSAQIIEHYATNELKSPIALRDGQYLDEYLESVRHLYDEIAINTSGVYSYYFYLSPLLTGTPTGFYSQFESDGGRYELSDTEFSNLTIITDQELGEYTKASECSTGEWVEPHPSRFTGESVISYIYPIYSHETFIGLLGFNMEYAYLEERAESIEVYEYGQAVLLSDGQLEDHNDNHGTELHSKHTHAITPLTNGMYLELQADYKDIQSNIRPMLSSIVVAFVTVLFVAIVFTFWITHRIVGPLNKLIAAASSISSGDADVEFVVESNDEIGLLSQVLSDTYAKIKEYSAYIKVLAYRDSLTGVKNRTAYAEAIEEIDKEINIGNPSFGVLVADVNYLKRTNDGYGHEVGNELLIHASRVLADSFKTSSVYRIGGDEFVVILRGADLEKYRECIDKMNEAFLVDYISVGEEKIPVSVAKGVSIYNPSLDQVYADVFGKADHLMYLNKLDMKIER